MEKAVCTLGLITLQDKKIKSILTHLAYRANGYKLWYIGQ